jgi:O-antigen/teichoic acid export membrane protein
MCCTYCQKYKNCMNFLDAAINRVRVLLSSLVSIKRHKIVADGGIYVFFNILNRALPFLLLPLITSYIDPVGFGIISVMALVVAIFTPVLGFCCNTVLYQLYFRLTQEEVSQFVNDSYKIILFSTALAMAIAFVFSNSIKASTGLDLVWFEFGLLSAGMGMITTITTTLFLIRKQARNYGLFQFCSILVNLCLTLVFLVALDLSWKGRIYAITATALLTAIIAAYVNMKQEDFRLPDFGRATQVKSIFRLGSALVPNAIGGFMILMVDRLMLTALTTLETLGIYAIGVMVAQITDVVLAAFSRTVQPYLYANAVNSTARKDVLSIRIFYGFIVFSFFMAGLVTILAPYVFRFMIDERYHLAVEMVGWLSLSSAFFNIGSLFLNLILIAEKNWLTGYISGICIISGVAVSYLFITAYGLQGAAMANATTGLLFMLLMVFFGVKHTKLPWLSRSIMRG